MTTKARLGGFVLIAVLAMTSAIFLIGSNEFLFTRTYRLYSSFDNVAGLPNGADVRVGGVHVGTVNHINLPSRPDGKVVVVMELKDSTQQVVRKDSVASILTEGLLGDKFVSISFGSEKAEPVRDQDSIPSEAPVDLSDLIRKSAEIMDSTRASVKNIETLTTNAKSIVDKIDRGHGTIGSLVNDRAVYNNLNQTVAQAKIGATAFQENMQALKRNWLIRGFYNDRGYSDPTELTKHEIAQLPQKACLKKFVFYARDLFQDQTTAKFKNQKPLNQAGHFLEQAPWSEVAVVAYSGSTGDQDQDLELTRAQAMVVRKYLVDHFRVDDTRMKTKGMGKDHESDTAPVPGMTADQARIEIIAYS